jgi:hypothetical protein
MESERGDRRRSLLFLFQSDYVYVTRVRRLLSCSFIPFVLSLCFALLCDFLMFTRARRGESEIGLYRWGMVERKKKKKKTMDTKWGRTDSSGETK